MKPGFRQFHGPSDWDFVKQHLPGMILVEDTTGIVCIDLDKEEIAAICIMDTWTHTAVHVHWIITNPQAIKHGFFEEGFEYVFNQADRELMIGVIPSNIPKALKLSLHCGFKETYRIKDGINFGIDAIIVELRKADCKYLRDPLPLAANG